MEWQFLKLLEQVLGSGLKAALCKHSDAIYWSQLSQIYKNWLRNCSLFWLLLWMSLLSVLLLLGVPSAVCWVALCLRCLSSFQCDRTNLVYFGKIQHLHEKLNPGMKRQKKKWIFCRLLKRSSVLSHPFAIPCVVTQLQGKEWTLNSSEFSLKSKETFFSVLKDVSPCSLYFFPLLHSLKEQSLYFHFSLFFHALFASLQPDLHGHTKAFSLPLSTLGSCCWLHHKVVLSKKHPVL